MPRLVTDLPRYKRYDFFHRSYERLDWAFLDTFAVGRVRWRSDGFGFWRSDFALQKGADRKLEIWDRKFEI
jgi:hypothetical protein